MVLQYLLSTIIFISGLVSIILNPLTIAFHFRVKRRTLPGKLYMLLGVTDLTCNLVYPFYVGYNLASGHHRYAPSAPSAFHVLLYVLVDVPVYMSSLIIMSIAVTRFIKIYNPFYRIKNGPLFGFIGICGVIFVSRVPLAMLSAEGMVWCPAFQYLTQCPTPSMCFMGSNADQTYDHVTTDPVISEEDGVAIILFTAAFVVNIVGYAIGFLFSLFSIVLLIKRTGAVNRVGGAKLPNDNKNLKNTLKISSGILIFNMVTPVVMAYTLSSESSPWCPVSQDSFDIVMFLCVAGWCVITSALNPLIVCVISSDLQDFVKKCILRNHGNGLNQQTSGRTQTVNCTSGL